jgi:hypothetical protein
MLIYRITGKLFDYTIENSLCKVGEVMRFFLKKMPPKDDHLMKEIDQTKIALEAAYSNFQNVVDPDLIDSCIYQLNAVQNRYRFLLKQVKATTEL